MKKALHAGLSGLVAWIFLVQAAPAREWDAETVKALRKEHKRLAELAAWRREKVPNPELFRQKLFEPVLLGNRKDFARNVDLAQKYRSRAEDATRNRQEETAKKFMAIGKEFYELSLLNKRIVVAIQEYKNDDLLAAYAEVPVIEKRLRELSGKDVPRDWFTPDELAIPLPKDDNFEGNWNPESAKPKPEAE